MEKIAEDLQLLKDQFTNIFEIVEKDMKEFDEKINKIQIDLMTKIENLEKSNQEILNKLNASQTKSFPHLDAQLSQKEEKELKIYRLELLNDLLLKAILVKKRCN